jgi:hypothetical protein
MSLDIDVEEVTTLPAPAMIARARSMQRHEVFQLICALVEDRREPGQSSFRAFLEFITFDPLGSDLFEIRSALPEAGGHHRH